MKVNEAKVVAGLERVASNEPHAVPDPKDRVTVPNSREVLAAIDSAKRTAGNQRSARLHQLEQAVRSGGYHPTASQVAEEILSAAEIDARLRAVLLGH
jgi:anti-sigma28 factor (negative regulator of flagellin synthesis)